VVTKSLNISKLIYVFLIIAWYVLSSLAYRYEIYNWLPVVSIGRKSWPLSYFLSDALALIAIVLWAFIFTTDYRKRKSLSLTWIALGLLLIVPAIIIYATYLDLTIGLP
jgi:hypothetical protein